MLDLAWLIIWLPFFGFLFNAFAGRMFGKNAPFWVAKIAPTCVLAAFSVAVGVTLSVMGLDEKTGHRAYASLLPPFIAPLLGGSWIDLAGFRVNFGLLIDPLSMLMALIVTGVGGLIHVYATGYMAEDREQPRFFTYFNLFIVMMLLLVMADNFLLMFVGWEGVGTCSYLLISFWYTSNENAKAGNKAFIVNRVGDLGFMLAMMLIWSVFGTLSFRTAAGTGVLDLASKFGENGLHYQAMNVIGGTVGVGVITAICFLLFVGAMGKSAQIPLWVWLPDAMAGPTPVSALIHAATMVTAGVVMLTRCSYLFVQSPQALEFITVIGIATAFVGATVALVQQDIKRVLAFSTVSQLGYMFVACGVGKFDTAMFHVTTHAFFKALLFLGSGAVIHSMLGEQDMRKMGGLRKLIPRTYWMMLAGTLAIAGVAPLSGFWSKDEILANAFTSRWGNEVGGKLLYAVGLFTALLTAFYMMRLMWKTFYTDARFVNGELPAQHHSNFDDEYDTEGHHTGQEEKTGGAITNQSAGHGEGKVHESPLSMMLPLYILAVFSVFFGLAVGPTHAFEKFLEPCVGVMSHGPVQPDEDGLPAPIGYGLSTIAAFAGIGLAYLLYNKNRKTGQIVPLETEAKWEKRPTSLGAFLYDTCYSKWGFDWFYNLVFVKVGGDIAKFLWKFIDAGLIDGLVSGVGYAVGGISGGARRIQTGLVRNYALAMLFGVIVLISTLLLRWNHLITK